MSKSKGNVIDPLGIVEEYGADALRMALVFGTGVGNDTAISEEKFRGFRNFSTKVWNASRFTIMNLQDYKSVSRETIEKSLTKEDRWILSELEKTVKSVTKSLETYRFHHAAESIYEFFWHKFCDKCIEDTKVRIRKGAESKLAAQYTLDVVLKTSLKLLHPFMPFVTEAIWTGLEEKEPLIISEWPK
jgi:valyl-tRNA synthetase